MSGCTVAYYHCFRIEEMSLDEIKTFVYCVTMRATMMGKVRKEQFRSKCFSSLEKKRLEDNPFSVYSFLRRGSGKGDAELLFGIQGWNKWEWFKAASRKIHPEYYETFLY